MLTDVAGWRWCAASCLAHVHRHYKQNKCRAESHSGFSGQPPTEIKPDKNKVRSIHNDLCQTPKNTEPIKGTNKKKNKALENIQKELCDIPQGSLICQKSLHISNQHILSNTKAIHIVNAASNVWKNDKRLEACCNITILLEERWVPTRAETVVSPLEVATVLVIKGMCFVGSVWRDAKTCWTAQLISLNSWWTFL